MAINNRIFGTDIPVHVKKVLEARQNLAEKDRDPNEQITDTLYRDASKPYYDYEELVPSNFDHNTDLSSRTPFVRVWLGIELFDRNIDKTEDNLITEQEEEDGEVLPSDKPLFEEWDPVYNKTRRYKSQRSCY